MKRIKYLGINLPKETKHLYIENYKTLMEAVLRKKNGTGGINLPHFRLCYKAIVIETV